MATAKELPSGNWNIKVFDYIDKNGKRKYKSFTAKTKKEVNFIAAQYQLNKKRMSEPSNLTVGEAIDAYLDNKSNILSPSTLRVYRIYRRTRVQSIMNISLKNITQDKIQAAINEDARTVSPKTIRNAHGLLSAVFKEFYPDFVFHTVLPQKIKNEISVPSIENINTLITNCTSNELKKAIILAYTMGLRRSEICALKKTNINFDKKTITINKAIVRNELNEWKEKTTKTLSSTRTLQMPDLVYNILKSIDTDKVVNLTPAQISDNFTNLVKKSGLPPIRFHDLRHFNASMMLSLNIPDKYAMQIMGHSTNNMLKNVYQHIIQDKMNNAYSQVNDYLNMQHEMQHKK